MLLPSVKIFPNSSRLLIYIFLAGIILLCLILLNIFLLSAKVTLSVNSEPLLIDFKIKLDKSINEVLTNLDTIPAEWAYYQQTPLEINNEFVIIDDLIDSGNKRILVFQHQALERLINDKLNNLLSRKMIFWPETNVFKYQVKKFNIPDGRAELEVSLQTKVIPYYDFNLIKQDLVSKKLVEAQNYLKQLPNIRKVKIKCWPSIFQQMPFFSQRINITLDII